MRGWARATCPSHTSPAGRAGLGRRHGHQPRGGRPAPDPAAAPAAAAGHGGPPEQAHGPGGGGQVTGQAGGLMGGGGDARDGSAGEMGTGRGQLGLGGSCWSYQGWVAVIAGGAALWKRRQCRAQQQPAALWAGLGWAGLGARLTQRRWCYHTGCAAAGWWRRSPWPWRLGAWMLCWRRCSGSCPTAVTWYTCSATTPLGCSRRRWAPPCSVRLQLRAAAGCSPAVLWVSAWGAAGWLGLRACGPLFATAVYTH